MPKNRVDHPIILGVVGDSAAGKTTLSAGIAQILGPDRVAVICSDDYHKYDRKQRAEIGISALDPACNYVDILEQHLELLRQGKPILKPIYDHHDGTLKAPQYITPKPYIIVEGLLGYATRAMRACYDVKVYLDPDEDLRVRWKIQRDTRKRGYTRDEVLEQLKKREKDTEAFIRPQRKFADIVVRFYPPACDIQESGAHLNVQHILRPTLPHPDLSPLLDPEDTAGLHLELARGPDGKPADVLHVDGNISDAHASRAEDLLWELIPEASHLRENVGRYTDTETLRKQISHPLALTQLLITYHMIKAALGVHAV